jgi:hypothetical protein
MNCNHCEVNLGHMMHASNLSLPPIGPDISPVWLKPPAAGLAVTAFGRTAIILSTLRRSGGISALARQLGETPGAITSAMDAALPDLLEDFLQCDGGLAGLLALLNNAGGGAMAQAILAENNVDTQPGLMILAKIKLPGSADKVSTELGERLMPLLAMLVGGYISARAATGELSMAEISALLDQRKTFYSHGEEPV